MNVLRFQARNSAEAIRQIRAQLGAEAIVLSVTPLPTKGLSRLWRRPGLEVLAGLPAPPEFEANTQSNEPLLPPTSSRPSTGRLLDERAGEQDPLLPSHIPEPELRRAPLPRDLKARSPQGAASARQALHSAGKPDSQRRSEDSAPNELVSEWTAPVLGRSNSALPVGSGPAQKAESFGTYYVRERARTGAAQTLSPESLSTTPAEVARFEVPGARSTPASSAWRTAALLQQMGLLPLCIDQVLDRVRAAHGEQPPAAFAEEFALVKAVLGAAWQTPPVAPQGFPAIHVFIGPPGSGKTTVLCKWLAKSVLLERQQPRTWRLDSRTANFAGLLDFYSEIFNVPLEREWRGLSPLPGFDLGFVDLPGTSPQDGVALQQLRTRLQAIPAGQVHLVLNAAYEVPVLLAQVRAFAGLPVSDLILTHLDEEKRRGKLWNLILGTNLPVRFLSGGQNIPGDFAPATPEQLFSR